MLTGAESGTRLYLPTTIIGRDWRKYLPGDFGSPHWYDDAAFAALVLSYGDRPNPLPLGEFIGRFTGLTGSPTRRAVRQQAGLDDYQLTDLRGYRDRISDLLAAMRRHAKEPTVTSLGPLGQAHLLSRLAEVGYGMEDGRHWYKRAEVTVDGVPWIAEVLVMETEVGTGDQFWLMNHSALLHDPTSRVPMGNGEIHGWGISGLFTSAHLYGFSDVEHVTVAHLICPSPTFTDRGKTSLALPAAFTEALTKVVWDASRKVYREWVQAQRDANRQERQAQAARKRMAGRSEKASTRDAVFDTLPAAYRQAGGDTLPVSCRTMFYQARPLVDPIAGGTLEYGYFSRLVAEYDREHPGELPNLYYEARGELVEPHTGRTVGLGTREIKDYQPGRWTLPSRRDEPEGVNYWPGKYLYDKVMYVEKKGLRPVLEAAGIAERYDMAIMWGEGNANVAARELADQLQTDNDTTISVLHDADSYGYNIALTLAEETARMPDHRIDVIDLGLTVGDALEYGLAAEEVMRKKAVPKRVLERLDQTERDWFVGTPAGKAWRGQRVELNAFTSTALVDYVEARLDAELAARGLAQKVLPPADVAEDLAGEERHDQIARWVRRRLLADLDVDGIVAELVAEAAQAAATDWDGVITDAQDADQAAYWPETVAGAVEADLASTEDARRVRYQELRRERIGRLLDES